MGKRSDFLSSVMDNVAFYGVCLLVILALVDSYVYRLPERFLGGQLYYLAVLITPVCILWFLIRFNGWKPFSIGNFKKRKR